MHIGDVKVTRIQEYSGPTHDPKFLLPECTPEALAENRDWLNPHHWVASMNKFVVTLQSWLIQVDDKTILIDTGVGNDKDRNPVTRMHRLNTLYLPWLEAAGAPAESVTHVVMTHLHTDHIGWNTSLVDGVWKPTFPNATYLASAECLAFTRELHAKGGNSVQNRAYADSVVPIADANKLELFSPGDLVAGCLTPEAASGHMPGQVTFHLESQAAHGMFVGDVLHNAIQIAHPEWNSCYDSHPELAREVRASVLRRAAERNALLMPAHFGEPYCGYVKFKGEGFAFEPYNWS